MKRTGELLKKAREDKRLSLHEVALFLKINSRVLQAIEEGDQAQLPARTFLRGFIQSYAKFLKLDSQMILQIFAEETAPPQAAPTAVSGPESQVNNDATASVESAPVVQAKLVVEEKTEIDVVSLEKSILTQSQVAQDKLGLKTIAISIVGLILVIVLYFANIVVKKYQREAEVDPINTAAVTETQEPAKENIAEIVAATPSPAATAATPVFSPATTPSPLPSPMIDAKPKLPEKTLDKPVVVKPVTPAPEVVAKPLEKPVAPAVTPLVVAAPIVPPTAAKIPEGKLIEVIVEATDSVEIEYSSAKSSPQKMVLKADQIHTFKSRSGVRLKISNGGAVNIIMNGRDLGAPGAAGQPIQVTY